ncbi:MAG TPA: ATP-dependent RecD-like DNA helicase [Anaerolineales bacterium]|nr:ATP-dependent RecD-like DNA helicase [Anaerolineales bacterium]
MDVLSGSVERITYYNPENGYSVIRLRPEGGKIPGANREGLVTVIGNLPELSPGEHLQLRGKWAQHSVHGLQFQSEVCEQTLPATVAGIRRYLGSGLVKGIGPRLAERIVARFGQQTLEVIERQPERLAEVPDIGPKRTRRIASAWEEQKQVKDIMLFLHSHGVSTNLAIKVYKQYGNQALEVVQTDPYRLARDIFGVGFKTADRIAQALGLPADHPSRIEAGVIYALNAMTDQGHVYAPHQLLVERAVELLEVPAELVPPAIERLGRDERVRHEILPFLETQPGGSSAVTGQPAGGEKPTGGEMAAAGKQTAVGEQAADYGQPAVYLTPLYYGEIGVAERVRSLSSALPTRLSDVPPAFVTLNAELSPEQHEAIRTALSHPVSVLTGGPGTGKTTALKALIDVLETAHKRYALASPTGRAAKRLAEATGHPASTIHRLLGFSPGEGFKFSAQNPLQVDILVVDEASMLELLLANHLLKALEPGTHLLLVGDVDQLPSVGAGDVLRDIIASDIAPVTRLSAIFRQASGSQIITNAHRINRGQMPVFPGTAAAETRSSPGDFFLFPAETPEEAAEWVQDVVCNRIPKRFGLAAEQIQVLAPMYRGPVGVNALNVRLQANLNPPALMKPEKTLYGQTFRTGDRVMQTQNDYNKDVYNGDIGRVIALDPVEQTLTIDFDGHQATYDWSEADQLSLAYAVSVHKGQGSEFPAVVIPLVTAHYMMLQRNLLYTAITRARQLCVLVGSRKAIWMAVRNDKVSQRYTALDWRLQR